MSRVGELQKWSGGDVMMVFGVGLQGHGCSLEVEGLTNFDLGGSIIRGKGLLSVGVGFWS